MRRSLRLFPARENLQLWKTWPLRFSIQINAICHFSFCFLDLLMLFPVIVMSFSWVSVIWVMPTMCLMICFTGVAFKPIHSYLIDCGSPTNTLVGGRVFTAHNRSTTLLSAQQYVLANTTKIPAVALPSSNQLRLYQSALIFTQPSKYTFPISQSGRYWIRLYFFPFAYESYDMVTASFSVYAETHLLFVSDFTENENAVFKEYSLYVSSGNLVLTLIPIQRSFAFLNALEVVSTPMELIAMKRIRDFLLPTFDGMLAQSLETVARVNIGGPMIAPENDTLSRTWVPEKLFLSVRNEAAIDISNVNSVRYVSGGPTDNIAPPGVYGTAVFLNGTNNRGSSKLDVEWKFSVESSFRYLVRCHFCNLVNAFQDISFSVSIDSWVISKDADLEALANSTLGSPYYLDAVTNYINNSIFHLSISPFAVVTNSVAFLNGIEIMKLSDSMGSFTKVLKSGRRKSNKIMILGLSTTAAVVMLGVLVGLFYATLSKRRKQAQLKHSIAKIFSLLLDRGNGSTAGKLALQSAHLFSLVAIEKATNNFDETGVIGVGGFGKVYKGVLSDGTRVAVKRSNPQSHQGLAEFRTEIELLSQFRHRHLVALIGFCNERNEMILVYEFMENGTLRSHLYGSGLASLDWKARLEICIGAARGLHYLHTGSVKPVIHRDVKSSNILLDKRLVARVSDFGLSKMVVENEHSHVSTAVRGTFGYLDPEYFRSRRLTTKSDVFSFGVVLFEVLCARPVLDPSYSADYMDNLANWALKRHKAGLLEQIIDPYLVGKLRPASLRKFVEAAEKCVADYRVGRPSMEEVLCDLEQAFRLQDTNEQSQGNPEDDSADQVNDLFQ